MSAAARTVGVSDTGDRPRLLQRLAALLAVIAIGEAFGIVVLGSSGDRRLGFSFDLVTLGFHSTIVTFAVMGALIVQRRPHTRVAWLMIAAGVGVGFGLFGYAYGVVGTPPGPLAPLPLALPALVLAEVFFIPSLGTTMTWILLLYPTDRLLGERWRWVGVLAIACSVVFVVGTLLTPGPLDPDAVPGLENPIGVPGELGATLATLGEAGNILGLVALVLAAASLVLRYRVADLVVRAQIRWLAVVAVLAVGAFAVSLLPIEELDSLMFGLGLSLAACVPIAIGIAITRYRLYDIDRLINRALVYGSLTAILAGVFTAGVGLAQRIFVAVTNQTSDAAIVAATLVVATLYAPLRKRLEAIVDRRFKFEEARFGSYRDELTKYLALTDPARASRRLVEEAIRELDALGGAIVDPAGNVVASAGIWPLEVVVRLPIPSGGPTSSKAPELVIGPRSNGRTHDSRHVEALTDVVALAGAAMAPETRTPRR